MIYHFYHQISLPVINFLNTLATVKNRSRKPMTITICNQILLKISAIDENEIDDTAYILLYLSSFMVNWHLLAYTA